MATRLHSSSWILVGDWNMVEHFDDFAGHSARLHGSEERRWRWRWRRMLSKLDLTDQYFKIAIRKGSIFTRQMQVGPHFDQPQLDKIYSSNRGSWYDYVRLFEHNI